VPKITEEILEKSGCINSNEEKSNLKEIMGNKKFKTKMVYKGSRDGWSR
jgi:hypothetical protein